MHHLLWASQTPSAKRALISRWWPRRTPAQCRLSRPRDGARSPTAYAHPTTRARCCCVARGGLPLCVLCFCGVVSAEPILAIVVLNAGLFGAWSGIVALTPPKQLDGGVVSRATKKKDN